MTKSAALQAFFESFGIKAYPASSVPDDTEFPWLTYEPILSTWDGDEASITVNLWYRTESEKTPNDKAAEISEAIGMGGKIIPCDGGAIWIKRGSPFCQSLSDEADYIIKRRYIQLTAAFLTIN